MPTDALPFASSSIPKRHDVAQNALEERAVRADDVSSIGKHEI
jgi:hypothetical protein